MKWTIPAKTFLLGEYAALNGAAAILLTTTPCFELHLTDEPGLHGIHRDAPAGLFWAATGLDKGLHWSDPYRGVGGMGASSAQFLGAYLARQHLLNLLPTHDDLLETYLSFAWNGQGIKPSGYDVLAQSLSDCVYIGKSDHQVMSMDWPFEELTFILLHTNKKLATHKHLQEAVVPNSTEDLAVIVNSAMLAFKESNSDGLIDAVNAYHEQLLKLNLVSDHSKTYLHALKQHKDILAAKGCGALGADVLLVLVYKNKHDSLRKQLTAAGWTIIATSDNLNNNKPLIENKPNKTLEILA